MPCETPDALEYDAVDHRIFISDNGADNAHQNIGVIDVQTNRFIAVIPLGQDQFGATGHLELLTGLGVVLVIVAFPQGVMGFIQAGVARFSSRGARAQGGGDAAH